MTQKVTPLSVDAWQEEQVFCHAGRYFDGLIHDIHSAHSSIVLETYIFSYDALGKQIISALGNAVNRGVRVRVLMDGAGSSESGHLSAQALEQQGVAVKIFRPLPWNTRHFRHAVKRGSALTKFFYFLRKINQRDHRKLCIIDNHCLWSGSLNISVKHLPVSVGGEGWRDYGVRVTGSSILEAANHFDYLWFRKPERLGRGFFRFYLNNLTELARQHKNKLLVHKIHQARYRIWIASAYFSPSNRVINALRKASRRKVDIRIIVPARSDVRFFPLLTATYYADLLKSGIRVFEYLPGMLHAKVLLIDDFCLVGSTNFNHRSFLHDLELDIVLHTRSAKTFIESSFQDDLEDSTEISHKNIHWIKQVINLGWLPRLLRYWL